MNWNLARPPLFDALDGATSVLIAGAKETFEECPPGTDVEVEMWDTGLDEETTEEFFLVLW